MLLRLFLSQNKTESNPMETQQKTLSYKDYLRGIETLDINEQLNLIDALSACIKARIGEKRRKKRNIMELEGLGAEIWKDIDAEMYISKERESWD